jgi:hypothetical protein
MLSIYKRNNFLTKSQLDKLINDEFYCMIDEDFYNSIQLEHPSKIISGLLKLYSMKNDKPYDFIPDVNWINCNIYIGHIKYFNITKKDLVYLKKCNIIYDKYSDNFVWDF